MYKFFIPCVKEFIILGYYLHFKTYRLNIITRKLEDGFSFPEKQPDITSYNEQVDLKINMKHLLKELPFSIIKQPDDVEEILNFKFPSDVYYRNDYINDRIIISGPNDICDHKLYANISNRLYDHNTLPAGPFYYYPPRHALGWHTNMESCEDREVLRVYTISCDYDYTSFFIYKHPISNQIHVVGDRDGYANIFSVGYECDPLWHAVINPSYNTKRLSLGFIIKDKSEIDNIVKSAKECLIVKKE
jgi:hypothetical protein